MHVWHILIIEQIFLRVMAQTMMQRFEDECLTTSPTELMHQFWSVSHLQVIFVQIVDNFTLANKCKM